MSRGATRTGTLASLGLVLSGLVVVGRLAIDAWLVRPTPAEPRVVAREPTPRPGPLFIGIVDGLREQTAAEVVGGPEEDGGEPTMPFWSSLAREGVRGVGITGEPTMTAACVRAILTGRKPDLYAAFANFDAPPARGGVVQLMARRGLRAAHAGDAAVWQLSRLDGDAPVYRPEDVIAFPDRGPGDQGETDDASFPFALRFANDPAISVLTFHVVRPDHVGHRHGATGPEYRTAARIVDEQLRQVVTAFRALRPDATVLLTADHGVTARGTHGGGEPDATRAPFVLVGPDVIRRDGVVLPQTSLAPTLCALLGLPMPPLADSPPALELTRLPPTGRVNAFDAFLRARIAVAEDLGRNELAAAIDARRRAAFTGGSLEQLGKLVAVYVDLEAGVAGGASRLAAWTAALLAAAWLVALVRTSGGATTPRRGLLTALPLVSWGVALAAGGPLARLAATPWGGACAVALASLSHAYDARPAPGLRTLTLGGLLAVPVLAGAGLLLQHAFDRAADAAGEAAGAAASRTVLVVAVAAAAGAAALLRRDVRVALRGAFSARPALFVAAVAGPLGFALSLRLFVDPFVHTPILFSAAALVALLLAARRTRGAPDVLGPWLVLGAVALALFVGGRVVEGAAPDWILSPAAAGPAWRAALALAAVPLLVEAVRAWRAAFGARGASLVLAAGLLAVLAAAVARTAPGAAVPAYHAARGLGVLTLVASPFLRARADATLVARLLACAALASLYHERSDAQVLVFALFLLGVLAASRLPFPATRAGVARLAVLLVAVRIAVFHAMGFLESFSTIDTGAGVVPGGAAPAPTAAAPVDGTGGITWEIWENALGQLLKFSLVWIALLSGVGASAARGQRPEALRALGVDLGIALAARGALLVLGMHVWWRSSWWVAVAYPTFALAVADVVFVLAGLAVAGAFARPVTPRPEAAPA